MKDALLRQVAGLAEAVRRSDHPAVLALLREYVYRTVVWSNDGLLLQRYRGGDLRKLTAAEIARLLAAREIGVRCGDTSVFLAKVYALFGYAASRFYYGMPEVSEHVVTVVALPTKRGPVPVIQDATFNATLSLNHRPAPSFFEVMDAILAGRSAEIRLSRGRIEPRTICFSDTPDGLADLKLYQDTDILLEEPRRIASGISQTPLFCAKGDLDFDSSYVRRNGPRVRAGLSAALRKSEEQCHVLELMLFPLRLPVFGDPRLHQPIEELRRRIRAFHQRVRCAEPAVGRAPY